MKNDVVEIARIWKDFLSGEDRLFHHESAFFPILLNIDSKCERVLEIGAGRGGK